MGQVHGDQRDPRSVDHGCRPDRQSNRRVRRRASNHIRSAWVRHENGMNEPRAGLVVMFAVRTIPLTISE